MQSSKPKIELPIVTYPISIWRPRWGDPVRISPRPLASEN